MNRCKLNVGVAAFLMVTGCRGVSWERDYESVLPAGYRQELVTSSNSSGKTKVKSVLIATRDTIKVNETISVASHLQSPDGDLPKRGIQLTIAPTMAVIVRTTADGSLDIDEYINSVTSEKEAHIIIDDKRVIGGISARVLLVRYKVRGSDTDVVEESAHLASDNSQYVIYRLAPDTEQSTLSEEFTSFLDAFHLLRGKKEDVTKKDRLPVAAVQRQLQIPPH